jgi:hypothetical protein
VNIGAFVEKIFDKHLRAVLTGYVQGGKATWRGSEGASPSVDGRVKNVQKSLPPGKVDAYSADRGWEAEIHRCHRCHVPPHNFPQTRKCLWKPSPRQDGSSVPVVVNQ